MLQQALQLAKDSYGARSCKGSCPFEADLQNTMVAFAEQAKRHGDMEVAVMILDAQVSKLLPVSSKRSWMLAFVGVLAAVAVGLLPAMPAGTVVTADFGTIKIIIVCVLLLVVARGVWS